MVHMFSMEDQTLLTWEGNTLDTLIAFVHRAAHVVPHAGMGPGTEALKWGDEGSGAGREGFLEKTGEFSHTQRSLRRARTRAGAGGERIPKS